MRDTLRMFNGLVERCFGECVTAFRTKALTEPEEKCVCACAEKYLKHSGRVGQRFGEVCTGVRAALSLPHLNPPLPPYVRSACPTPPHPAPRPSRPRPSPLPCGQLTMQEQAVQTAAQGAPSL